jgi:hypothetical protein
MTPSHSVANRAGNRSYAGYEYQIEVTVWVALDLMLAKGVTELLTIEPPSQEDIQAGLVRKETSPLRLTCDSAPEDLSIQVKSRSTGPWTAPALAGILQRGNEKNGSLETKVRLSPLRMLAEKAERRYIFITNEGLARSLRPHSGEHLLDFPEVDRLPPRCRGNLDPNLQKIIARRLLLCAGVTQEVLESRTAGLLTAHGHVPIARHGQCIRDLRDAVRHRITGYANGRWTRGELLQILFAHGGCVLPTRAMDHYVPPQSYTLIRRCLDEHHVVIIAGPSGTGKSLTADIVEAELRRHDRAFDLVGEEHGPGFVRAQLMRTDPVLFHLRDPWGGNRLRPGAERWSDELPKLIRSAGPGRKFLVTSRSDVLFSSGVAGRMDLAHYIVTIEIEHYGRDRLAQIYDRISSDLSGDARSLAITYRERALQDLARPYEIDRFLVALMREVSNSNPLTPIDVLLRESQIDAISSVVARQTSESGPDGAVSAAIVWALLSARGGLAVDVLPKILRALRRFDPSLRPEVLGLVDLLVAGRNLRKERAVIAFYHPRVEDGLRMAMLERRAETEHVLSVLVDTLAALDPPGEDWGIETAREILRTVSKLQDLELRLASETQSRLDTFLELTVLEAAGRADVERAFEDLQQYGSDTSTPSRLARLLMNRTGSPNAGGPYWQELSLGAEEMLLLKQHPRTRPLLELFIREVLPFTRTTYNEAIIPLLLKLGGTLTEHFKAALDAVIGPHGHFSNIDAVLVGAGSDQSFTFDEAIDHVMRQKQVADTWLITEYAPQARRGEEHEVDASTAEGVYLSPENYYYGIDRAMEAIVRRRREADGLEWIVHHPQRQLLISALVDIIAHSHQPPPVEDVLFSVTYAKGEGRSYAWSVACRHWYPELEPLLEFELSQPDLQDANLRQELVTGAFSIIRDELTTVLMLARVAASGSIQHRLALVCDLMSTRLDRGGFSTESSVARRRHAELLARTLPAPQDELGLALCDSLGAEDIRSLGHRLSGGALELLAALVSDAPLSIAGVLGRLAAAVGINPIPAAERLLATGEIEDGEDAVQALLTYGTAEVTAVLHRAGVHARYHVRRYALAGLVSQIEVADRAALLVAAEDRSAEVRLRWAKLMAEHRWPEAIESLVALIKDHRNFSTGYVVADNARWTQYCVARAAVRALGAYEQLPRFAIDALLAAAGDWAYEDPFVACAALSALATKEDERIAACLLAALFSPGLVSAADCRPIAQAAGWAIFDRARADMPIAAGTKLVDAACESSNEIAGPLLMACGLVGGHEHNVLLGKLSALGLADRAELVLLSPVMIGHVAAGDSATYRGLLDRHAAGEVLDSNEFEALAAWSRSLDATRGVQRHMAWIASMFDLPVAEPVEDLRAFRLPKLGCHSTGRSSSRFREEADERDSGY